MTSASTHGDRSGTPIRVLHVDDDPNFADLVDVYLDRKIDSVEVLTEHSADDGLDRLREDDIDCVVSDYEMPVTDGLEFLDAVRDEHPDLPFILFTGRGSESVASEAISAGVTDYLQKESGTDQYTVLANRIRNAVEHDRSKRALEASEQRLSLFIEQSPFGVLEWNTDFEIVQANATAEEILGYAADDLSGRPMESIVPEHARPEVREVLRRLMDDAGGYHNVNENVTKSGETIVCEWHNRVVTDDAGEPAVMFSQFKEVTERERYKRRLETLIKNLPGMVYRCRNDPGWPMEFVSGECAELTGYDAVELESGDVTYGEDVIHPDDQEEVLRNVQRAVDAGEPFELTYRIRTRESGLKWVWERGRAVRSDDGTLLALEGFISDVTPQRERHGVVEALHEATRRSVTAESEAEIAEVMTTAAAEVLGLPHTGIHLYDDDRELLDPVAWTDPVEETIGGPPTLGPGTLAWDAFENGETGLYNDLTAVDRIDESETVLRSELIVPLGDHGVVIAASTETDAFEHDDRRLVELLAANTTAALEKTSRERTLQERERALERENERLETFTSVVSHDLRNPLTVAKGQLDLARDECESERLDEIASALDRMDTLITDMLTLARDGKAVSDIEPVDLGDIVERCWTNVATDTATLAVETDRAVMADSTRLAQLFENLFRNAVDHGPSDVAITVGDVEGGFYVEDDGPGIPEDRRDTVFEAGYSTSNDATGFGLSIVRDIAEAHGWSIRATEEAAGGTRFEVTEVDVVE